MELSMMGSSSLLLQTVFFLIVVGFQLLVGAYPFQWDLAPSDLEGVINMDLSLLDQTDRPATGMSTYRTSQTSSVSAVYRRDRQRAQYLVKPNHHRKSSVSAQNMALSSNSTDATTVVITNTVVSYLADVKVGSKGQSFKLIIDTGSSNTWIGSQVQLQKSNSTTPTGNSFSVAYGSGGAWGDEVFEKVSISSSITVNQSIGIASEAIGFRDVDGILGLGPSQLTIGTQTGPKRRIPTIVDSLYHAKKIAHPILGVSFVPSKGNTPRTRNGRLTFGGVDSTLFTGPLSWIPRTSAKPAAAYWGLNLTIKANDHSIMTNKAGITDTGTTLILLPDDAFERYVSAIPNAKILEDGLVMIPDSSIKKIPTLVLDFGGIFKATLSPEQQLMPIEQATFYGTSTSNRFSFVGAMGTPSGTGLDFILGQKFLEHYYTAYDSQTRAIGIAPSFINRLKTHQHQSDEECQSELED